MKIFVADVQQCAIFKIWHNHCPVAGKVIIDDGGEITFHDILHVIGTTTTKSLSYRIIIYFQMKIIQHHSGNPCIVYRLSGILDCIPDGRTYFPNADKVIEMTCLQCGILASIDKG